MAVEHKNECCKKFTNRIFISLHRATKNRRLSHMIEIVLESQVLFLLLLDWIQSD